MAARAENASPPSAPPVVTRPSNAMSILPRGGVRLRALVLIRWARGCGPGLHRRRGSLGPGVQPARAGGWRRHRSVGVAQSHRQHRPPGVGAHRRSRGRDLPRLRYPAVGGAALPHRRSDQSVLASVAGPRRDRRHDPVARQQHRTHPAHHCQHRRSRPLLSATAVERTAAPPAGDLPGRRLGWPFAHDLADHALRLAARRGGTADGRCAGGGAGRPRARAAHVGAGCAGRAPLRTNSARRFRPSPSSPRRCSAKSRLDDPLREDVELLAAESDRCRSILARLSVDPAGDVSDAYTLVPCRR